MSNQHTYTVPFTAGQLRQDYESGMTQAEIATKYQTTQKVVFSAMKRFGIQSRKAVKRDQRGSRNSSWVGDAATYAALHKRVEIERGMPRKCGHCGTLTAKRYEWANLTGKYADTSDYVRLCCSCHKKHDASRRRETGAPTSKHVHRKRKEVVRG